MIKGSDLENRAERPETTRGPREKVLVIDEIPERLERARALPPPAGACRTCFQRGRDAVVELVSRSHQPLAERLAAAAEIKPKDDHVGDPTSFPRGRDAAIAAIRGDV